MGLSLPFFGFFSASHIHLLFLLCIVQWSSTKYGFVVWISKEGLMFRKSAQRQHVSPKVCVRLLTRMDSILSQPTTCSRLTNHNIAFDPQPGNSAYFFSFLLHATPFRINVSIGKKALFEFGKSLLSGSSSGFFEWESAKCRWIYIKKKTMIYAAKVVIYSPTNQTKYKYERDESRVFYLYWSKISLENDFI